MKTLEIRRHARRDPDEDALSPEGRVQAEDVGRTLTGGYDLVFVSPAKRAAETAAWFLRAAGQQLPLPEYAEVQLVLLQGQGGLGQRQFRLAQTTQQRHFKVMGLMM